MVVGLEPLDLSSLLLLLLCDSGFGGVRGLTARREEVSAWEGSSWVYCRASMECDP